MVVNDCDYCGRSSHLPFVVEKKSLLLVKVHSISQLDNALVKCSGNKKGQRALFSPLKSADTDADLVHIRVVAVSLLADP